MQSTLFTTLTANEEANLSGGNKKKKDPKVKSILANLAVASSAINQVGVGGDGGTAGNITIGGKKSGGAVLVDSPVSANANGGSVTNNATSNPVAVNAPG
ncbi:MAG: hypothetical protein V7K27_27855 [Nostoc sp.]|uniref:hypothetical protein n=1 Tax=Nostoc sp. TaxID=1180 RepID=UPI002FF751F8